MFLKGYGLVANLTMFVPVGFLGYGLYQMILMNDRCYETKDKKYVNALMDDVYKKKVNTVSNSKKPQETQEKKKIYFIRQSDPNKEPDI
jgi:hypothetical protein